MLFATRQNQVWISGFYCKEASVQFPHPSSVPKDPLWPPPHTPGLLILSRSFPADHNRQILQHLLSREISTESFTHLLFLLCLLLRFPSALFSSTSSSFFVLNSSNYSLCAAGTEPEWKKLSHQRRFTSSTSIMATWVTLQPRLWLCKHIWWRDCGRRKMPSLKHPSIVVFFVFNPRLIYMLKEAFQCSSKQIRYSCI